MDEKLAIGKKAKKEQDRLKKADIEEMIMDVYVYIFFVFPKRFFIIIIFGYYRDFEDEDDEMLQWELEAMKAGGHIPKKYSQKPPDLMKQTRSKYLFNFILNYYLNFQIIKLFNSII
jgi:hypothetical protein